MYVPHASDVQGDKKTSDLLVLELQMLVSHHVDVGNKTAM